MRLVVTGGAGFIGANFVRTVVREYPSAHVTVLDSLTYAANRASLLADVAEMITLHEVSLRSAHVVTLGRRAVDVLYLSDGRGRPLEAPLIGRLIAALMDAAASG